MNVMIWVWLGAIVVFGGLEAATAGLVCIWFVAGAIAALLAAVLGTSVAVQTVVFVVVSVAALALTRPLVQKLTNGKAQPTNLDRVIGQHANVTEEVDNEKSAGAVYVDGKTWTARSVDGNVIPAGTQVEVERMEGVKLFVKYVEKTEVVQ